MALLCCWIARWADHPPHRVSSLFHSKPCFWEHGRHTAETVTLLQAKDTAPQPGTIHPDAGHHAAGALRQQA